MDKFTKHTGVTAAITQSNVDTDAIIPSREMKLVSKKGLGEGLFSAWRYKKPGSRDINPDFILNKADYANTSIILAGVNFGCGSSREHAVWALAEYGIRAIIAPSFGSIFYNNCVRNGILPIVMSDDIINKLMTYTEKNPQQNQLTINLAEERLLLNDNSSYQFSIPVAEKNMLINGLDAIALTLQTTDEITVFEATDKLNRTWAYLA